MIILLVVAIITTLVLVFTNKPKESFTELYFEDHQNLPKDINVNENNFFAFTIHNMENQEFTYSFKVTEEYSDKVVLVGENSVTLQDDQIATIPIFFTINDDFETAKIKVELLNKEQEIHFWVR